MSPQTQEIKGKWQYTISKAEYDRLVKFGNVTKNGVVFFDELAGPGGIWALLIKEQKHTDKDISDAIRWLRGQRDVVSWSTGYPEWEVTNDSAPGV